jgi:sterol desaturase/sphingolipid hydroxylase (fatty acid hydroxylase superfamily)
MGKWIFAAAAAAAVIAAAIWLLPSRGSLTVGGVNILPWLLPGVMTVALAEGIALSLRPKGYDWKAWFVSSCDAMVRQLIALVPLSLVGPVFALAWQHRLFTVHLEAWWTFVLLLLGQEFCYYWLHRAGHHIRWFWATHAVHHSPNDYTLAAAFRLGWTSKLSGEAIFNAPLIWLGVRPDIVAATLLFSLLYQFWLHTELAPKLGWLEWALNTPSHHRVHHGSNHQYLDRNFGGTLIVFDRLFGTFVEERADIPSRYGLVNRLSSYNPLFIALHEWMAMARDVWRARNWRERLFYAFGPPGWSPAKDAGVTGENSRAIPDRSPSERPQIGRPSSAAG